MSRPIMIVDDAEVASDLIKIILERSGVSEMITCTCPLNALKYLQAGLSPALIITDYRMPAMNGVDLLEEARSQHPGIRGVIITGDPDSVGILPRGCTVLEKGHPDFFKILARIAREVQAETSVQPAGPEIEQDAERLSHPEALYSHHRLAAIGP